MSSNARTPSLRLLTFNIVRSTRVPLPAWAVPYRVKRRTHERFADVLARVAPDVLALQEVDATTAEALRFDGERVGDPALHCAYLASRAPVLEASTHRFRAQGFFRDKGMSVATIRVDGFRAPVRVVSVHLDAFSPARRGEQIEEMKSLLGESRGPLVVLGDLNDEDAAGGAVDRLSSSLDLTTRRAPRATYDFLGVARRLDWVLVSRGLAIASIDVVTARLSDHLAVAATIEEAA